MSNNNKNCIGNLFSFRGRNLKERLTQKESYRVIFLSTLISGLLAHGMVMFNHFYYNDDIIALHGPSGMGPRTGRWFMAIISKVESLIFGFDNMLIPLYETVFTIIMIAFIGCVIVKMFKIERPLFCILLGSILTVFPSNACLLGYMLVSRYSSIGLLVGFYGAYIACCKENSVRYVCLSAFLISCGLGCYQAYLPIFFGIFLLYLITVLADRPDVTPKSFLGKTLYLLIVAVLSVVLYFIFNEIMLSITGEYMERTEYFTLQPFDYIRRFGLAFMMFFTGADNHVLLFNSRWYYVMGVTLIYIYAVLTVKKVFGVNKVNAVMLIFLLLFLPVVYNFIYVMCPAEIVYSNMEYNYVIPFVMLIWLVQRFGRDGKAFKILRVVSICVLVLAIFSFVKVDNMCYAKAEITKERTISYFTTLITDIKNTDGYSGKERVLFINPRSIEDASIENSSFLKEVSIAPYHDMSDYINNYAFRGYLKYWCGYAPQMVEEYDTLKYSALVEQMSPYPAQGAIRLVGDTIFVKLGDGTLQKSPASKKVIASPLPKK